MTDPARTLDDLYDRCCAFRLARCRPLQWNGFQHIRNPSGPVRIPAPHGWHEG
jgi:hypothetical protein